MTKDLEDPGGNDSLSHFRMDIGKIGVGWPKAQELECGVMSPLAKTLVCL